MRLNLICLLGLISVALAFEANKIEYITTKTAKEDGADMQDGKGKFRLAVRIDF